jgi:hypothetical protein
MLFYIIPVGTGGVLKKIEGLDVIKNDSSTLKFIQFTSVGGKLTSYPDFCGYVGMFYSMHNNYEDVDRYLEKIKQTLRVVYE